MKRQRGEAITALVVLVFVFGGWMTSRLHKAAEKCEPEVGETLKECEARR